MLLHSSYRRYSAAATLSFTAFGAATLLRGWLVSELSGSPFQVSLVLGLFMLPMLLFTTFGGLLADRYRLPRLTALGDLFAFAWYVALALLIFTGVTQSWHVLALSFAHGASSALTSPARQSMITDLVPRGEGRTAIGISTLSFNVSQIFGPLAAGLLISRVSLESAALVPALLALPASVLYSGLRLRRRRGGEAPATATGRLARMTGGIAYVIGEPSLRWAMVGATVLVLTANTWGSLFPSIADDLGRGAAGLATISMAVGLGSVFGSIGSVVLAARYGERAVETWSGFVFVGLVFGLGMSGEFMLSVPIAFAAALAATVFFVTNMTAMQLSAPQNVRGRVIAARFVMFGLAPAGMAVLGAIAELTGPRPALSIIAVAGAAGFAAVQLLARRRDRGPAVSFRERPSG